MQDLWSLSLALCRRSELARLSTAACTKSSPGMLCTKKERKGIVVKRECTEIRLVSRLSPHQVDLLAPGITMSYYRREAIR